MRLLSFLLFLITCLTKGLSLMISFFSFTKIELFELIEYFFLETLFDLKTPQLDINKKIKKTKNLEL